MIIVRRKRERQKERGKKEDNLKNEKRSMLSRGTLLKLNFQIQRT
jgi:hypothetical protein